MTTTWFRPSYLPDEWRSVPLRRVGRVLNGGTPAADPSNWGGEIPFVTPPDLNGVDGAVLKSTGRTLSKSGAKGAGLAPAGSVLVSTRAPIGHVGRVAEKSAFNQGCRAVAPQEGTDPRYVAAVLVAARAELTARGQGTTFFELSSSALASILTPLPPLDEQRAIADYLDQETGQIDALVAKQEEFIELLRERRIATIDRTLSVVEAPRIQLRRALQYLTSGSRGWGDYYSKEGDRFLRIGNLSRGGLTLRGEVQHVSLPASVTEGARTRLRLGDLLFSITADIGSVAVVNDPDWVDGYVSQHVALSRLDARRLDPHFVGWAMLSAEGQDQLRQGAVGGTKIQLALDDIRELKVPAPPLEVQRQIADNLDEETCRIDTLIAKAEEHIALVKERRSALITAAVTGKFDVRTARKAG